MTPKTPNAGGAAGFYGMAPTSTSRNIPESFNKHRKASPDSGLSEDPIDLEAATAAALEEWSQINAAIHVFGSNLGPHFQPLSEEYHQPLATPFGNALQYRSYDIGVIWALYNMAKIIIIRSHPAMPPASIMAAGVAASQTAQFANEIGRIVAGVVPPPSSEPISPPMAAALIACCMPMFFAGIQYTDAAQRAWLIPRILDIEHRTGFASAGLIAYGCETAWEKMGAAGRGPPYTPLRKKDHEDDRIAGRVININDSTQPLRKGDFSDRRYIFQNAGTRVHWALGLLGAEKDLKDMK